MIPSKAELASLAEEIRKTTEGIRVPGWDDDAERAALFMAQVDLLRAEAIAYAAMLAVIRQHTKRISRKEERWYDGPTHILFQPEGREAAQR